jgi:hypothetical protein
MPAADSNDARPHLHRDGGLRGVRQVCPRVGQRLGIVRVGDGRVLLRWAVLFDHLGQLGGRALMARVFWGREAAGIEATSR